MIGQFPAQQARTPDEVSNVSSLMMDPDEALITAGDFLVDDGVTVSSFLGKLVSQLPPFRFIPSSSRRIPKACRKEISHPGGLRG